MSHVLLFGPPCISMPKKWQPCDLHYLLLVCFSLVTHSVGCVDNRMQSYTMDHVVKCVFLV